jgi:integrase
VASISKINGKWRALVRRKGHKSISRWFDTKGKAAGWAEEIEAQIDAGTFAQAVTKAITVSELIAKYRKMREISRPILDTSNEHYTLKMLGSTIGGVVAASMTVDDLIGWAQGRKDDGAGPYTVNCDLSKLGTVFRYAGEGLPDVIGAARPKLSYLGLIGGGGNRERRPTEDEMARLHSHLIDTYGNVYGDAFEFAAVTAMRRGEVCAIKFSDIDHDKRLIQVARKHPRKGKVVEWVPLMAKAWKIVQSRPKDSDKIFPVHPQTISKYFKTSCDALGIPDLHFHDLRHEGTSALFEGGMPIQKVALVTGHKSWSNLKRYTNLKPESVHDTDPDTLPRPGNQKIVSFRQRKTG